MRILAVMVALMVLASSEGWVPNIKWRNPSDPNAKSNQKDDFLGLEDIFAKQTHRRPKYQKETTSTTANPKDELLENILKIHRQGNKGVNKQKQISQLQEQLKKVHELLQTLKERKRRDVNSNTVSKKEDLDKTKVSSLSKQISDLEKDIDKEFDYAKERELQEKHKKHMQKYETILNIEKQLKHMQKEISSLEGSRKRREDSYNTRLQNSQRMPPSDDEFFPMSEYINDKRTNINNDREKEYPTEDIETQKTGKILPNTHLKEPNQEIRLSPEQKKQIRKLDEQVTKVEKILASVKGRQRRQIKSRNRNKLVKLNCVSKSVSNKEVNYDCSTKPTKTIISPVISITMPATQHKQGHLLCVPGNKALKCAVQRKHRKGSKDMFLTVPTETLIHQGIKCEYRDKDQNSHNAAMYYLDCVVTGRGKRGVSQIPYPTRDNYREIHDHKNTDNTHKIQDTQNQIPNQISDVDTQNQLNNNNTNNKINNADTKNQISDADQQLLKKCAEIQSQKTKTNQINDSTTTKQDQTVNGTTGAEINKTNTQNQIESNKTEAKINDTDEQSQINNAATQNQMVNANISNQVNVTDKQNQINQVNKTPTKSQINDTQGQINDISKQNLVNKTATKNQINETQGEINSIGMQNQINKTHTKSQINNAKTHMNGTDLQNQIDQVDDKNIESQINDAKTQINDTDLQNQIDQVKDINIESQINNAKNQINDTSLQNQIDQVKNVNRKNQINTAENQINGTATQQQINDTNTQINKIGELNTTQEKDNSTQNDINKADNAVNNNTEGVVPEIVIIDDPKYNKTDKQTETDKQTDNNKQKTLQDSKQGVVITDDPTFDVFKY